MRKEVEGGGGLRKELWEEAVGESSVVGGGCGSGTGLWGEVVGGGCVSGTGLWGEVVGVERGCGGRL